MTSKRYLEVCFSVLETLSISPEMVNKPETFKKDAQFSKNPLTYQGNLT